MSRLSTAAKIGALFAACAFAWVLFAMNAWGPR